MTPFDPPEDRARIRSTWLTDAIVIGAGLVLALPLILPFA
jgi:hypothetical protein